MRMSIEHPLRTLRSTRAGLFFHGQLRSLAKNATFPATVKVINKTLSTEAAAWTVPPHSKETRLVNKLVTQRKKGASNLE